LISNGDILYASPLARQIKEIDYPGCHLTWAVASNYKWALIGNPYIDRIWEIPIKDKLDGAGQAWFDLKQTVLAMQANGEYDEIFFTQIGPDNWHKFDGMIRSSILRNYPRKISVPVDPIVVLSQDEVKSVNHFARDNQLNNYRKVILFECLPQSFQSFITPTIALSIAEDIASKQQDVCFIMSSNLKLSSHCKNVIDGSVLSIRETAELTKYCHLLIGCSSGITWISTSTWAKPLPMIQLLNTKKFFASVEYDLKKWKRPVENILEMTNENSANISLCVKLALDDKFTEAKEKFGEVLTPFYSDVLIELLKNFFKAKGIASLVKSYYNFYSVNGFNWKVTHAYFKILLSTIR